MLKGRAWISAHVPHAGEMCLLDEVMFWNADRVRCRSAAHRVASHPLRAHGRLGAACGIEFAAQAMALHGALVAADSWTATGIGFLASVRELTMHVARLDDLEHDLVATADRLGGDLATALYQFTLSAGDRRLLAGRATVILAQADTAPSPLGASR
ncbi:MAG: 3-hydroxylacyl-ACP dehydratase [Gammaproteobacteria bacterium]|nr:3-hydroxylacyl-ACP dehydratase [Gammaproteobacteria bacterium]